MPRPLPLVLCALVVLSASVGRAEDAQEPRTWWGAKELPRQWRPTEPESDAVKVPDEITSDENVEPVSLKQAIAIALENNPRIAAQRLEPPKQEAGILGAQAQFDPTLAAEVRSAHSRTPNQNILSATDTLVVDERSANAHLIKRLRHAPQVTFERAHRQERELQPAPPGLSAGAQLLGHPAPAATSAGHSYPWSVSLSRPRTPPASSTRLIADFVAQVIAYWGVSNAREPRCSAGRWRSPTHGRGENPGARDSWRRSRCSRRAPTRRRARASSSPRTTVVARHSWASSRHAHAVRLWRTLEPTEAPSPSR